jgi:hypothetical protein
MTKFSLKNDMLAQALSLWARSLLIHLFGCSDSLKPKLVVSITDGKRLLIRLVGI